MRSRFTPPTALCNLHDWETHWLSRWTNQSRPGHKHVKNRKHLGSGLYLKILSSTHPESRWMCWRCGELQALWSDLILFIYNTVSLCPCLTFGINTLLAVIFSATYWIVVAVQQSGSMAVVLHKCCMQRLITALRWVSGIKSQSLDILCSHWKGKEIAVMYSIWEEVGQVCEKNKRGETAVGVRQRDYHKEICFD